MIKLNFLLVIGLLMGMSMTAMAQQRWEYPDSLKGVVVKIEPLSFLYQHFSGGVEVPLGKMFLDVNVGASGLLNQAINQKGGFVSKVGIKIPLKPSSPFSILYLMPEVAISRYKLLDYSSNGTNSWERVNASAILLCLGYRHISPSSNFYYDGGVDFGYGWANQGNAWSNYNFNISINERSYMNTTPTSTSGAALSCHVAIGILIKPKSAK